MKSLASRIRAAVKGGLSHRKAAAKFGVSIRQVQTAINPEKRKRFDSGAYRTATGGKGYWRRWPSHQRDQEVSSPVSVGGEGKRLSAA